MNFYWVRVVSFVLVGFLFSACVGTKTPAQSRVLEEGFGPREVLQLKRVIDGDSLELLQGGQIRLVGVNAPEWDAVGGKEAFIFAKGLVEKTAQGKRFFRRCLLEEKDKFDRLLAFVELDGLDLQEELLRRGLAVPMVIPPCGRIRVLRYEEASYQARQNKKGLWKDILKGIVSADEAEKFLKEYRGVKGKVLSVHETEKAIHLNFGINWRTDFTATLYREVVPEFERNGIDITKAFLNREVLVFGFIRKYYGSQILLYSPLQIEIVDSN